MGSRATSQDALQQSAVANPPSGGAGVQPAGSTEPPEAAAATVKAPWKKDPPPDPLKDIKMAVLAHLNRQTETVFALLDGARNERVNRLLKQMAVHAGLPDDPRDAAPPDKPDACEYQSLYIGTMAAEMAEQGPYLVRLPKQCPLLEAIIRDGWGDSWGFFLTSRASLSILRHHFRRFIMVRHPDGDAMFFRFYDPRVLSVFLPTCDGRQLDSVIPAGVMFIMENRSAEPLIFSHGPKRKGELLAMDSESGISTTSTKFPAC